MQTTYETPEPIALYVELGSGSLHAKASDTGETEVRIDGPRADEFHVDLTGRQLSVIAPKSKFFSGGDTHSVEVFLPEGSDLITRMGSADTQASGTFGQMKLKSGSGDIELGIAEGPVVIESGSGDVRAEHLEAGVRVKSGSGDIEFGEVQGNAGISTGSGDVLIGSVHDSVIVKTGSGDLEVKRADANVSLSTASGHLRIGHASQGEISAKSASGDVQVGVPLGTPVWTDINSLTGQVASNLQPTGEPAEGQSHLEIRATTVSGDVRLVQV